MVESTSEKTVIAFGITGSGKSYTLNLLAGIDPSDSDDEDNIIFKTAAGVSVTKYPSCAKVRLNSKIKDRVNLVDVPGMCDTDGKAKDLATMLNL